MLKSLSLDKKSTEKVEYGIKVTSLRPKKRNESANSLRTLLKKLLPSFAERVKELHQGATLLLTLLFRMPQRIHF